MFGLQITLAQSYQFVSCQLTDDWTKKTFNISCEQPLDTQDDTDIQNPENNMKISLHLAAINGHLKL